MTTQPGEISQEFSPIVPSEGLRPAYASSAEDSSPEGSSVEGSSDGPKRRRRSLRVTVLLTDAAVLALSLGHLVLTILLMCYNGRPIDASYDTLQSILTTIGPIFPMVFAFVVSRLLYHAARFRLENGASLGTLEQLMGSRTVGSAVATHFELRAFNILGLLILFVWAFSPVGGQSFLRVLDMAYPPANTSLFYLNTLNSLYHFLFYNGSRAAISYISAHLFAEFGRPGPTDLWGNIKIPLLDVDSKSDVWHKIDHDTTSYSAFIGMPIGNISVGNSTFYVESSHLQLKCDPVTSHILDKSTQSFSDAESPISELELDEANIIPPASHGNRTFPVTEDRRAFVNGSWYGFQHARSGYGAWNIAMNRFVDKRWFTVFKAYYDTDPTEYEKYGYPSVSAFENETAIEAGPTFLLFQARRNMTLETLNTSDTSLWIIADQPRSINPYEPDLPDFTNISTSQLSRGLTKVINSYMLIGQTGPLEAPGVADSFFSIGGFENVYARRGWSFVPAETTHLTRIFCVSWPWMAACFASCGVMATCGILGVILVHRGNNPEILGFVSAIVRDSRYIKMATDVDHMNGDDLSRMLKSERLRYGYTSFGTGGTPQMGIGREAEITKVEG